MGAKLTHKEVIRRFKGKHGDRLADAAEKWREIVSNLEDLRHYAKPDELDSAREAIREIVGEISVFEKDSHVFAKTKLNENMGFESGAQKRT